MTPDRPLPTAHVRLMGGVRHAALVVALDSGWAVPVAGFGHVLLVPAQASAGDPSVHDLRAALAQPHGLLQREPKAVGKNVEVEVLPNSSGEDRIVVVFEGVLA